MRGGQSRMDKRVDLFVYGTLMVPSVMARVSGFDRPGSIAKLNGFRCRAVRGELFPAIVPQRGEVVSGLLYSGLSALELSRLDDFEGELYQRRSVRVDLRNTQCDADTYVLDQRFVSRLSDRQWSLARFLSGGLERFLASYPGFDIVTITSELNHDER